MRTKIKSVVFSFTEFNDMTLSKNVFGKYASIIVYVQFIHKKTCIISKVSRHILNVHFINVTGVFKFPFNILCNIKMCIKYRANVPPLISPTSDKH